MPGRPSNRCSSSTGCCPGPSGKRRVWTAADQFLVDEANTLLNGTPFTYGHVVVDEAQDHSAVALRVIGRRSPSGSMTMVGDVAQSTTPAGQERWRDVFANLPCGSVRDAAAVGRGRSLTIGYRVPEPILEIANRLLPLTGVDAVASRACAARASRRRGTPRRPTSWRTSTAAVVGQVKHRHRLTGVVAPLGDARGDHRAALAAVGLVAVDHVHNSATTTCRCSGPRRSRASSSTAWWSSTRTRSSATTPAAPASCTWR